MPLNYCDLARRPSTPPPDDAAKCNSSIGSNSPSAPSNSSFSSADDCDHWEILTNCTPSVSGTATPAQPFLRRSSGPIFSECSSWDSRTFSTASYLLPADQNGDWRTQASHAISQPSELALSVDWSAIPKKLGELAESASDNVSDSLNRAFEGQDLPALHDRVVNSFPSLTLPSRHQLSQSVDALTDAIQSRTRRRRSVTQSLGDEFASDHLSFAHHMGAKARRALVRQRICKEWQIMPTRATLPWQSKLDTALSSLFLRKLSAFSVAQLFSMTPLWSPDADNDVWRLELDTGLVEVVVELDSDEFEEKCVCLATGFGLSEEYGCLRLEDVERGVVDDGEWMAVC